MANSSFFFDNQADLATITASSTAGGTMAAANVQNTQRTVFWRSGTGTTSRLDITLAAIYGATHLALVDLNLTTAGTIRVQSWSDAVGGSVPGVDMTFNPLLYLNDGFIPSLYGSGLYGLGIYGSSYPVSTDAGKNLTLVPLGVTSTDAYWRITFTDANTTYQQCGRLFIGNAVTMGVNLSYGWSAKRIERSVAKEALGGQRFVVKRQGRLQITGLFEAMTDTERTQFLIRLNDYGESKPFIFSVFPEQTSRGLTTGLYGRFSAPEVSGASLGRNRLQFTVLEEL